jgi:hypothetical protein
MGEVERVVLWLTEPGPVRRDGRALEPVTEEERS